MAVAAGVTEASLTTEAWHYFTATATGLHRYRCNVPSLRAELFDGERLQLRDETCRVEGWSYFKAETGGEPSEARSAPNVAINDAVFPATSSNVPMTIELAAPKSYVGMWIGNGESEAPTAVLTAYDSDENAICQVRSDGVPEEHTLFAGLHDPAGRIAFVTLDYGATSLSESVDDLVIAP